MAWCSSDGRGLFPAAVPCGPFRTSVASTEAVAAPLHRNPVAPLIAAVVAPIAS